MGPSIVPKSDTLIWEHQSFLLPSIEIEGSFPPISQVASLRYLEAYKFPKGNHIRVAVLDSSRNRSTTILTRHSVAILTSFASDGAC